MSRGFRPAIVLLVAAIASVLVACGESSGAASEIVRTVEVEKQVTVEVERVVTVEVEKTGRS